MVNAGDGSVATHYEYDPFGNLVSQAGDYAEENPYRFSTKYQDQETDLYYYGYRYYSAELGRWINRDPIGEYGGLNQYCFALNHAINKYDILGIEVLVQTEHSSGQLWSFVYVDKKGYGYITGGQLYWISNPHNSFDGKLISDYHVTVMKGSWDHRMLSDVILNGIGRDTISVEEIERGKQLLGWVQSHLVAN